MQKIEWHDLNTQFLFISDTQHGSS